VDRMEMAEKQTYLSLVCTPTEHRPKATDAFRPNPDSLERPQ
jgi:hypothetical protein